THSDTSAARVQEAMAARRALALLTGKSQKKNRSKRRIMESFDSRPQKKIRGERIHFVQGREWRDAPSRSFRTALRDFLSISRFSGRGCCGRMRTNGVGEPARESGGS